MKKSTKITIALLLGGTLISGVIGGVVTLGKNPWCGNDSIFAKIENRAKNPWN